VGILDKLTEGAEKIAHEAEKVYEQGKTKVEELQLERQMDVAARKLGYLEYNVYRGLAGDPAKKEELLAELARVDGQIREMKAATAASEREAGGEMAEVRRVEDAAAATGMAPQSGGGAQAGGEMAEVRRVEEAAAAAGTAPDSGPGEGAEPQDRGTS
jgi:hypothetical protein